VYYLSDEGEDRESQPLKSSVIPLLRENVHFLKGNLEAQLDYVMEWPLALVL
jgi:hypothetical protein